MESVKEAMLQTGGIRDEVEETVTASRESIDLVTREDQSTHPSQQDASTGASRAAEASPGARPRRKRHIFTEYEDKLLMKVLERRPGERKQELERLSNLFAVPYLTLRHRFYTVIKRKQVSGLLKTSTEEVEQTMETVAPAPTLTGVRELEEEQARSPRDPMEELLTLPARVERIEKRLHGMLDLKGFIDRLIDINRQLDREQELLEELAQKEREIERMREEMQKKIQRINAREEELDDLYKQLETTLHQFMNLSSIDKLKVLGDFTIKIETVIDRFGNVVRRRPIVVP
ncbi:MAG: hypothetical protein AB1700_02465 [Bacillota bacterium]